MQVKCDFCGSFMEDGDYSCPNCGATNAHMKRTASDTPKTIDELKTWYEERQLPPYETTRFFIGIDYKEPKAFGIYKDRMRYIVYKNKADGTRAVRYSGNDEAYAVNELYLRLKEEILNQKNRAPQKTVTSNTSGSSSRTSGSGCFGSLKKALLGVLAAIALAVIGLLGVNAVSSLQPQYGGYYAANGKAYYFSGYVYGSDGYEWWEFNPEEGNWDVILILDDDKDFPSGVTHKDHCDTVVSLADAIGYSYESTSELFSESPLYANNSMLYKDKFHYSPSENSYYVSNGRSYFFLNDLHGQAYGERDNSGWYVYDDGWEYLCSKDDRDTLGDELWYDADKHAVGQSYSDYVAGSVYYFNQADTWNSQYYASDFNETSWFQEYEAATAAYNEATDTSSSSSSSDSTWDWSSTDTWDSGSTDWSSDW